MLHQMGLEGEVLLKHQRVEEVVEELQAQNDLEVEEEAGHRMRLSLEQVEVGAEVNQVPQVLLQEGVEAEQEGQSDQGVVEGDLVVALRLSEEKQVLWEAAEVEREEQLQEWMAQDEVPAAEAGKWELELAAEEGGQMVHLYWELWGEAGAGLPGSPYEAVVVEGRQEQGFGLEVRVEQRPCARP